MNKIYIYLVKPIYFSTGRFSGFLSKIVYKIDNVDKIMTIHPDSIKRKNRLTGLKVITEKLKNDIGLSTVVRELPREFEKSIKKGPICLEVSDEVYELFKNKLK